MKKYLTTLVLGLMGTAVFAQNEMMHLPNGTSGISNTVSQRGVAIGPGFDNPRARLHLKDDLVDGTGVIIDIDPTQVNGQSGATWDYPDFFLEGRVRDLAVQQGSPAYATRFSVDNQGRIQAGFNNPSITEQLALSNNLALYDSGIRGMKLDITNNRAIFLWRANSRMLEFINEDNSIVALRLGEAGEVGINTGTWTSGNHKLHVEGGALADYSRVQPTANWDSGDNYLGMYFTDNPEIRWNSDAADYFEFKAADTGEVPLRLSSAGKVGINTDNFGNSNHSLYIAGSSVAEEMFVKLSGDWGDFVFEKEYDLMPLDQLEDYLEENKHLPDFPSAAEVEKDGLALGETERLLTIKVEELTLYILELKKEIDTLKEEIKD